MTYPLTTTKIQRNSDIRAFFNIQANNFSEQHGHPESLLKYRIQLLCQWSQFTQKDIVLDIGCGIGHHLMEIADKIARGIGIDFSQAMIREANKRLQKFPSIKHISFRVDDAELLQTVNSRTVDKVICVAALEHIPKRETVIQNIHRVLKTNGKFTCLTPNGSFIWYRILAPLFHLDTKHLSTDRFVSPNEMTRLLLDHGFQSIEVGYWTFIPKGDMTHFWGATIQLIDRIGQRLRLGRLRSGLIVSAVAGSI